MTELADKQLEFLVSAGAGGYVALLRHKRPEDATLFVMVVGMLIMRDYPEVGAAMIDQVNKITGLELDTTNRTYRLGAELT